MNKHVSLACGSRLAAQKITRQSYPAIAFLLLSMLFASTPGYCQQPAGSNGNQQPSGTQRFTPIGSTQRFSSLGLERSQRFGIQQVGEATAQAARISVPAKAPVNPAEIAINKGDQLNRQGAYDRAIEQYQKALAIQPKQPDAHMGIAYAYIQQGNYDGAINEYQEALALAPKDSEAQLNLGVAYYLNGRIDDAIAQYQQALTVRNSKLPEAHFNLGMAYAHQGNFELAIENYQKAIEQKGKNYPEAYNNLGLLYEVMKDYDNAVAQYRAAAAQPRGYPLAHYNMARIFYGNTKYDKALQELQLAIKQQANFPEAYLDLGNVYFFRTSIEGTNEFPLAVASYQKALEQRNGFYPLAYENLAITYFKMGKAAEAMAQMRSAFEQAEGQCPETLENLVNIITGKQFFYFGNELSRADNPGNLKYRGKDAANGVKDPVDRYQGKLQEHLGEALEHYDELESEQKDDVNVRYCAGLAHAAAGNWKDAIDELARAVELSGKKDKAASQALNDMMQLVLLF